MMRRIKDVLNYWGPPAVWAAGIFALSSLSHPPAPPRFPFNDKVVHFLLYAVLALLIHRAFLRGAGWEKGAACWAAFLLAAGYGITDEFHQWFVPNRSVEWTDWIADALGAAMAFLACLRKDKT